MTYVPAWWMPAGASCRIYHIIMYLLQDLHVTCASCISASDMSLYMYLPQDLRACLLHDLCVCLYMCMLQDPHVTCPCLCACCRTCVPAWWMPARASYRIKHTHRHVPAA